MTAALLDDRDLRAESQQIDRVLGELEELVVPAAWQRIEQVMRTTVALYGAGLAHALELARRAGAGAELDALIADDELLASLLVLHGLHPLTVEQRVERTIAALRDAFGCSAAGLEITRLTVETLELEAARTLGGDTMSPRYTEMVIRRALEAAAPELRSIVISGLVPAPRDNVVQLRGRREAP